MGTRSLWTHFTTTQFEQRQKEISITVASEGKTRRKREMGRAEGGRGCDGGGVKNNKGH